MNQTITEAREANKKKRKSMATEQEIELGKFIAELVYNKVMSDRRATNRRMKHEAQKGKSR